MSVTKWDFPGFIEKLMGAGRRACVLGQCWPGQHGAGKFARVELQVATEVPYREIISRRRIWTPFTFTFAFAAIGLKPTGDLKLLDEAPRVSSRRKLARLPLSCGRFADTQKWGESRRPLRPTGQAAVLGILAEGSRAPDGKLLCAVLLCTDYCVLTTVYLGLSA